MSDRIARAFNMSRPIRAVANPRLLTRFGILVFFTNFGLMEFQVRYLVLFFFLIGGLGWFRKGILHKNIQCWSSSRVHSWSCTFLLYINDLPDDVICNMAIYADDTTLYSKCDQASDLWQQLELASELESDL